LYSRREEEKGKRKLVPFETFPLAKVTRFLSKMVCKSKSTFLFATQTIILFLLNAAEKREKSAWKLCREDSVSTGSEKWREKRRCERVCARI
jgi:hypothetical protein